MYKVIATALLILSMNVYAESGILAVWEETPNGLVRVDNQHYVHQPQQVRYPAEYHPGLMSPDFIHRPAQQPQYTNVIAHMLDCNCYRKIQVRVN